MTITLDERTEAIARLLINLIRERHPHVRLDLEEEEFRGILAIRQELSHIPIDESDITMMIRSYHKRTRIEPFRSESQSPFLTYATDGPALIEKLLAAIFWDKIREIIKSERKAA